MKRRASRLLLRLPLLVVSALSFFSGPVKADTTEVTGATDYWFQYEAETVFFARTYAIAGVGSDPMLWLYNSDGQNLAQNDDHYGLQSRLELTVPAGWYRLRAGVCCGNPDAWWQGVRYTLEVSGTLSVPSTTTTSTTTTTTEPETTTTTSTTTTSTTTTSTTVPETTTSTSTTVQETTSTSTVPETTTASTTTTVPETSTTSTTTSTTIADVVTTTEVLPTTTTTSVDEVLVISPTITTLPSNQNINTTSTSQIVSTTSTTFQPTTTSEFLPPLKPVATTTTVVEPVPTTSTTIPPAVPMSEELNAIASEETTKEEAEAIFATLEVSELSEQEIAVLVNTLNTASDEVKEAFEQEINIYSGQFDDYVPTGSAVSVGTRRVIVAATGVLFAMPTASATTTRRK